MSFTTLILFYLFNLILLIGVVSGYYVTIDSHGEECFYERAKAGTKLLSVFEVADGGFLDIDFKILDPNKREIYKGEKESSGRYLFNAQVDGVYTFCLGNIKSTKSPKYVLFSFEASEQAEDTHKPGEEGKNSKLEDMVKELAGKMVSVKHEQDYMEVRDRVHRNINESTNSRILMWSLFEALVLLAMTAGQVFYLKRFFEVRRIV